MKHFFFPMTALLLMVGCSNLKQPPSAIVKRAEACGAGDLSTTSGPALQDWFGKHRDCAGAVDALCKPIREKAAAAWSDSSEGQVCRAARNIAQWARKPLKDHETFQSGWK